MSQFWGPLHGCVPIFLGSLRSVTLPGGTQIEYVIDGQNRRIGKKVNGTLVQGLVYDGQLRIVAEVDGTGNVVSRFVYGDRANVPSYMVKGGVTYRIIADQAVLMTRRGLPYDCPSELPLDELIACEMNIIEPAMNLYRRFTPVSLLGR